MQEVFWYILFKKKSLGIRSCYSTKESSFHDIPWGGHEFLVFISYQLKKLSYPLIIPHGYDKKFSHQGLWDRRLISFPTAHTHTHICRSNLSIPALLHIELLAVCIDSSLRPADAFPVVASLPPKNRRQRSDDPKCVCGSQANDWYKTLTFVERFSM